MTTTAITTTSDLLDQLNQHLAAIIKERDDLREVLQLIQGFNWQLDNSPHGQEIKRRALLLINPQRSTSE